MLTRWRTRIARWREAAAQPEGSPALRRWAWLAAGPPLAAVAWYGGLWLEAAVAGLVLAAGHRYSARAAAQAQPDARVRLGLFVALHLAVLYMCGGLFAGLNLPQVQFALLAQAITSFDLRSRLNVLASLGMSLLVLYAAATLARDYAMLLFLPAFVVLALKVFQQAEQDDGARAARLQARGGPAYTSGWRGFRPGFLTLATLALAAAVYALAPQFSGRPLLPPFSFNLPIRGGPTAQVLNPAVPLVQFNGVYAPDDDYYYGFDTNLDLRYRGGLSDAVVMYVRSPAWSYWRSHSYDFYNGYAWSQSDASLTRLGRGADSVAFPVPPEAEALGEEVVQTYQIVRDQPNLVFAAYRPTLLYMRAESVSLDSGAGLRVGGPLTAGTLYTVISRRPIYDADRLRAAGRAYPVEVTARYLQLPAAISERVRALARQVTAGAATPYDQAMAVRDYLRTIPYDFFPPPAKPGAEVVDTFLFEDRRGVCEMFATAQVVMLRTLGVPARIVAGYGPGEHNPLSGYYTVRQSDAHGWVEVYFPGYGWVPFDPTPGWTPAPYMTPVQRWIFSGAFDGLGLPLGDMAAAGAGALLALAGPLLGVAGLIGVVLGLAWLAPRLLARWRRWRARERGLDGNPARRRILAAYRAAQGRLRRRRAPTETPREFAGRWDNETLAELTRAVEVAAYRPKPPAPSLARRAEALLRRLARPPRPRG